MSATVFPQLDLYDSFLYRVLIGLSVPVALYDLVANRIARTLTTEALAIDVLLLLAAALYVVSIRSDKSVPFRHVLRYAVIGLHIGIALYVR